MEKFNFFQQNQDLSIFSNENYPLFKNQYQSLQLIRTQSNNNKSEQLFGKDFQIKNTSYQNVNLHEIFGQIKNESFKQPFSYSKEVEQLNQSSELQLNDYQNQNRGSQFQEKKQQKLKRNRQNAKMCRQRKKQYISQLENKTKKYQKRIQQLETKLKEVQLERDRLKNGENIYIKSFEQSAKQLFIKIQEGLKIANQHPQALSSALNQIQMRFSSNGKDRVNLIDYYMSQIIEHLLCDIHKYMINTFINNRGMFGQNNRSIQYQLMQLCCQQSNICGDQVTKLYKPKLQKQLSQFNEAIQNFYNSHVKLRMKCTDIQKTFHQMQFYYSQAERANLLLWFQKNSDRKELNLRTQWFMAFKANQNQLVNKIKKLKKIS